MWVWVWVWILPLSGVVMMLGVGHACPLAVALHSARSRITVINLESLSFGGKCAKKLASTFCI